MEKIKKINGSNVIFYSILWAVIYIGSLLIVRKLQPPQTVGIIVSFLPTVAFIFFIYNFIKKIGSMDEVQRRIQLEATVWAFSLGLLLLMTLGLLDLVIVIKKEYWGYTDLIPYFFAFYWVGILISKRKYN
jgi:hypothetical protein